MKPEVQILLSTFNGSAYLKEQLNSILSQTYSNWQLLIKDDGSSDDSVNIIKEYQKEYPAKIKLLNLEQGEGSSKSFMSLLKIADSPYIMFCDQDDVWLPTKVEFSLSCIKEMENISDNCLFFTDMKVVSADLNKDLGSFFELQKLNPEWVKEEINVLVQSIVAGCTIIINQNLKQALKPIKTPLFQHDQWLVINAILQGAVNYSAQKTMLYRQHQNNAVGAHHINFNYFKSKVVEWSNIFARWQHIRAVFNLDVSYFRLLKAKVKLNSSRLMKVENSLD